MEVKTRKSKVLALVLSLLIALAFMPAIASAATSTELDFAAGGSSDWPLKPVIGASDKTGWGYIAVKAVGGDSDAVTCVSNDEDVAIVESAGQNGAGYYKFNVKAVAAGETTVTVTAADNPAISTNVPVVVDAATSDIWLEWNSPAKLSTAVGAQKGGLIAVYAAGGTEEYGQVTCESQDETIATVTATGSQMQGKYWKFNVTGVKKGETKITVTAVEDPTVQETVSVTVVEDLVTVKYDDQEVGFNIDEFSALDAIKVSAWAGRNHYFSFLQYPSEGDPDSEGPTVASILTAAGVDIDALDDDQLITFIPSDNPKYAATFTVKQILRTPRYFFPNSVDLEKGEIATEAQLAGAVETPTIICKMDNTDSRLVFGQVAPNERSVAYSCKCMSTGGTIEISDQKATQLNNDVTASVASGSNVKAGTEIKLDSETMFTNEIYYTLDGSTPTVETAALYNYCTKGDYATAKIVVPDITGTFTVKVMQYAYGTNPSAVKTFTYKVGSEPAPVVTPKVKKGATYTVNSQRYKVTKVATAKTKGTVTFTKSKNAKKIVVPKTVKLKDGKLYKVTVVGAKAFKASKVRLVYVGAYVTTIKPYAFKYSKATKIFIKTKKLKKTTVKKSLKGSKVKYVYIRVGTKKANKTYVTKYKKYFTKANAGKKVTVK